MSTLSRKIEESLFVLQKGYSKLLGAQLLPSAYYAVLTPGYGSGSNSTTS